MQRLGSRSNRLALIMLICAPVSMSVDIRRRPIVSMHCGESRRVRGVILFTSMFRLLVFARLGVDLAAGVSYGELLPLRRFLSGVECRRPVM